MSVQLLISVLPLNVLRTAEGTFAENQKTHTVRAAFHRAVVIPVNNIEHLWKEYNIFETVRGGSNEFEIYFYFLDYVFCYE